MKLIVFKLEGLTRVLIGSAEKPKRSFMWSFLSVSQQVAVM